MRTTASRIARSARTALQSGATRATSLRTRAALALGLALALAVAASGCAKTAAEKPAGTAGSSQASKAAEKSAPLKIGYLPITHSAPLMLSDAAGIEGAGVELVKFASWPELTDALNAGRIDGAVTMLEIAYASVAKGVPIKLVALSHRGGDALTVTKGIESAADLKGERVAIPHRLSGHNLILKLALEEAGLTLDDVVRVEMTPSEMPAALARGDVKAFLAAEPFGTLGVVKAGGRPLLRATDLWDDWLCCGLVVRDSAISERPADVQALVDGFVTTGATVAADPATAAKTVAAYTPYDATVWQKSFELGVTYDDLTPRADELERLRAELDEEKLLPGDVDPADFLDESFISKATAK